MLAEYLRLGFQSGYRHTSKVVDRGFNLVLSLFLLALCAPLFAIIALVILVRDGRPVFYKGVRLGMRKKPFMMYKFRTLVPDAETRLGRSLLESRHRLYTSCGRFLRDTRLDELPQLWNIMRGDMDFLGPRPERPEIYEFMCRNIPHYNRRFTTKPGLIGFSQVFTPHTTPKRIRTTIDNRMIERKQRLMWDSYAIALTGIVVARTTMCRAVRYFVDHIWRQKVLHLYKEKRELTRVRHKQATARLRLEDGSVAQGELRNINERSLLVRSREDFELPKADVDIDSDSEHRFPVEAVLQADWKPRAAHAKRKTARCRVRQYRKTPLGDGRFDYVLEYNPATSFNYYLIHQYFLKKSMTHCTKV